MTMNHEHDFCIPVWKPMPGTAPGFEQHQYCSDYQCECGKLRFAEDTADELSVKVLNGIIVTRAECAVDYAKVIRRANAEGEFDVAKLNDAIIIRWSRSGLDFIKKRAWQIVDPGSQAAQRL